MEVGENCESRAQRAGYAGEGGQRGASLQVAVYAPAEKLLRACHGLNHRRTGAYFERLACHPFSPARKDRTDRSDRADGRVNSFIAPADTVLLYLAIRLVWVSRMVTGIVYYCWSCDGHCRANIGNDQTASCPRCGKLLGEDCRVTHPSAKPSGSLVSEPASAASRSRRSFAAAS